MYHDLAESLDQVGGGRDWFAVDARTFGRQLDLIVESGRPGCNLASALDAPRPIGITFDDGVSSDYEIAFPALAERGLSATFFVVTDWIGTPGHVNWCQLRSMRQAGMSIQSHTRSHPFLSELSAAELVAELRDSKAALDDGLAQDTSQLALPGGDAPRARLRGIIQEAGYRVVATSRWGANAAGVSDGELAWISRCTIAGRRDDDWFRRVLAGDRMLGMGRRLREVVLARLRSALGPSRYAAWRRRVLHGDVP